jgi:hypothetical protein
LTDDQNELAKEIEELHKEVDALAAKKAKEYRRLETAMRELEALKADSRQLELF